MISFENEHNSQKITSKSANMHIYTCVFNDNKLLQSKKPKISKKYIGIGISWLNMHVYILCLQGFLKFHKSV